MKTAVTLQDRLTRVVVAPELGGSLVSWTTLNDERALLRPATLPATSPRQLGCYPLVPWSNRVASGGFDTPEGWMALPANTEGSPLAVHGSAWQQEWDISAEHKAMFEVYLNTMRQQETAFYASIGVDNALSVYGQNNVTFWDLVASLFGKSTIGYDYSLDDMARFGISNIVLLDDEWDWRKYRTEKKHLVKRVPLSDDYSFRLQRFAI